jgi:TPR repeat protein
MYANGTGVPQDYEQAMQWYIQASDHGLGQASNNIGMMYWKGVGVETDQKKAAEWMKKGAEQGYATSQSNLGYCYENGYGVEEDIHKAVYWYDKAYQQGETNPKESLAKLSYRVGLQYYGGAVIEQNYDSAMYFFFQKAAELGNDKALYKLGQWYEEGGGGIKKDMKYVWNN